MKRHALALLLWLPPALAAGDAADADPRLLRTLPVPANAERLLPQAAPPVRGLDGGPARAGVWRRGPDGGSEQLQGTGAPATVTASGVPLLAGESLRSIESMLADLERRDGIRLHFVGHTDGAPLTAEQAAAHGDARGLSAHYARLFALAVRARLELPPGAVTWAGAGATRMRAEPGSDRNRRVEVYLWQGEPGPARPAARHVPQADTRRIRVCRQEPACVIKRRRRGLEVVQLRNLVEPIRFAGPRGELPAGTFDPLARQLERLGEVPNLRLRFVGHTDAGALSALARERVGDAHGLARAYAREVARAARERLGLAGHQLMIDSAGAEQPLAPNDTARGRRLNRRVEVEIWHDPVGSGTTVSELQACPVAGDLRETVTEPWEPDGEPPLEPVPFVDGEPRIGDDWLRRLVRIHDGLAERGRNPRIEFIGHTGPELLDRRAALVYGDERGLAETRARRVMQAVAERTGLPAARLRYEGKGFGERPARAAPEPADTPAGRVEVRILVDVPVPPDPDWLTEAVEVTRETEPRNPYSLPPLRITVDGEPVDDGLPHTADVQRCTDLALDAARVQLRFDPRRAQRRLEVTAEPSTLALRDDPATERVENRTTFRADSNYPAFHQRAEVRVFAAAAPLRGDPLDVVPLGPDGVADWYAAPGMARDLKYVLRVYDAAGRFDETAPKRLWLLHRRREGPVTQAGTEAQERLAALDETAIARRNIPLDGGTLTVTGQDVPPGVQPWVLGEPVPLDAERGFVAERIVPRGLHTAEVALLDDAGNGDVYLRDLRIGADDWYLVGLADITLGVDDTSGPAALVTGDEQHFDSDSWIDGRLAYYANGLTDDAWEITSSADTREGPLDELFDNFADKRPDALFRRVNPDRFRDPAGDDSSTVEDAPTSGKFHLRAEKGGTLGLWGNFQAELRDNELAPVDRGLYGGYGHYESVDTTSFGARRTEVDAFGSEPGTVVSREEFRGTGGSLYFLKHQDIAQGSERVRVEVRDRESGLVLEVNELVAGSDYDIDPIQGRVLLSAPLPSTAGGRSLVRSGGTLAGNPVFLVVRYEFTPGFGELDDVSAGGRVSRWLGDSVQVGATAHSDEQLGARRDLAGLDVTWRDSAATWVRLEAAQSEGVGTTTLLSDDGGFGFTPGDRPGLDADGAAWRLESAAEFGGPVAGRSGRGTLYLQQREAGFAAPGQATTRDTDQAGGTLALPVGARTELRAEIDHRAEVDGLATDTLELSLGHRLDARWELTTGVRVDDRADDSPVVPVTQTEGRRTDLALRADYRPEADWSAYGFAQGTADTTETRADNNRAGAGGSIQLSDRLRADGELSGGDGGAGARLGTSYLYSQATELYAAYSLANERAPRTGVLEREGSFVSGFRTRYSDSLSLYAEERYAHGDVPTGLTHAFGADKRLNPGWTLGLSLEAGTLEDQRTGAELERRAFGVSAVHTRAALDYRAAVELRTDETDLDERETYLLKNRVQYRLSPSSRLLGKLNLMRSDASQGEFFDGEFVDAVLGYGLRPVGNDRWNTLFRYNYFFSLPAPEQENIDGTGADFVQRSHIVSTDTIYEVDENWTLGGKLAFREGEVATNRVDPDFTRNRARLLVLRADWHLLRRWDLLFEGRRLELVDAEEARDGVLVGAYRHFGDHVKVGIGYNFADFSDDLTDLDYDSQGAFINIVGKY